MSSTFITKVTMLSGQSLSPIVYMDNAVDLAGRPLPYPLTLWGMLLPSGWTAADVTFQGTVDNTNWKDLYNANGGQIGVTGVPDKIIVLPPAVFSAISSFKIRSGTNETPVAQGANRDIYLLLRSC